MGLSVTTVTLLQPMNGGNHPLVDQAPPFGGYKPEPRHVRIQAVGCCRPNKEGDRMMRMFSWRVALLWLSMLAMVAVATVPAVAQEAQEGQNPDSVDVTFEVTIDGQVPEGRTVTLNFPGTADLGASFCSSSPDPSLPTCEDGGTYTATFFSIGGGGPSTGPFTTSAGQPRSYEYQVFSANGNLLETLASETITPTQDTTVNVTYRPGGEGETTTPDTSEPTLTPDTGASNAQYGNTDTGATGDQYGQNEQGVSSGSSGPLGILPDTGGASLVVGLLGALLVGGGLFARRLQG